MAKKIIFLKMSLQDAIRKGAVNNTLIAVPMTGKDIDVFNKLGSPFRASITKSRNLMHHRLFFAHLNTFVDNDILERVDIKEDVLYHLKLRFKDLTYVLVYILKYLFLPLERKILPNGVIIEDVSSIAFDEMDQDTFKKFYDDSIQYCCDCLGVTIEQLDNNGEL
jgi:hypothetical protein